MNRGCVSHAPYQHKTAPVTLDGATPEQPRPAVTSLPLAVPPGPAGARAGLRVRGPRAYGRLSEGAAGPGGNLKGAHGIIITVAPSFKLAVAGGTRGAAYNVREACRLNTDAHGLHLYYCRRAVRESSGTAEPSGMESDPLCTPWQKAVQNWPFDAPYLWLRHGRPVDNCRCPWLRHAQDVRLGACVFRQIPLGSRPVQVRAFFVPGRRARRDRIQPHRVNGPLRARHHGPDLCHA